jgi:transposase
MTVPKTGKSSQTDGRRKRRLTPSEKYEIWLGLLRGEYSTREAADRAGVDRSTIMKLREVAKQGALDALSASRPGRRGGPGGGRDPDLVAADAEIARLTEALAEMGVRLMLAEGKERWG